MKTSTTMLAFVLILMQMHVFGAMESSLSPINSRTDTLNHTNNLRLSPKAETLETFNLASFKLPYIKYHSLDLIFYTSNESRSDSWKDTTGYKYNFSDIYSNITARANYSKSINSPTEQSLYSLTSGFFVYPYSETKKNIDNSQTNLTHHFSTGAHITGTSHNRYYISAPVFIELGSSLGVSQNRRLNKNIAKDSNENPFHENSSKANTTNIVANLEIGLGSGRIEEVTDAQLALFILKELKKENRLLREPNYEEIYKLAELMSQKRNQRFFDNRHKIIDQVKAIDSFLTSLGLSNQPDASYFTTIYDNWQFANNPSRSSGFRISGGAQLNYTFSQTINNIEFIIPIQDNEVNEYTNNLLNYGVWLKLVNEKPINHYWQRTIIADFNYIIRNYSYFSTNNQKYKWGQDNLELNLNASAGYYPSTRTYLNIGLECGSQLYNLNRFANLSNSEYDENSKHLQIYMGPTVVGYYYISPKVRFNIRGKLTYNFFNSNDFNLITPPPGLGFTYVKANIIGAYLFASLEYSLF